MKGLILFFSFLMILFLPSFSQQSEDLQEKQRNLLNEGSYDAALYYAEEIAAAYRGMNNEHSVEFAEALHNLVLSHFYMGNYRKALYYANSEIELREKLKLTRDVDFIESLEAASKINSRIGDFNEAVKIIMRAERSASSIFGNESIEYANMLSIRAGIYNDMGSSVNDIVLLKQSNDLFAKAEYIFLKNGEKAQSAYIINKSNRAVCYQNSGNTPLAETNLQQVLSFVKNLYGDNSKMYAIALNNLGVLYFNYGSFRQAENYFVQSIDILKNNAPDGYLQTGICLNNLAALYHALGNFSKSTLLFNEASKIFDYNKIGQSPVYAVLMNNKASVTLSEMYYASPEKKSRGKLLGCGQILLKADTLYEKNCVMPQPDGYDIMSNISLWYKLTGDSKKSNEIMLAQSYQSGLSMQPISMITKMKVSAALAGFDNIEHNSVLEAQMIPVKIQVPDQMINEDQLRQNEQDQNASTRFLLNLIIGKGEKVKKTLGPYHYGYAALIKGITPLYKSIGSVEMEEDLMLEYLNILNHNILQDFTFLSESEKEMYMQTRLPDMYEFMAYALERKEKNPDIACNAYNLIIQNKGLMLKSSSAMRVSILQSHDPELIKTYDSWLALQKEISILYATPVDMRKEDLNALESKSVAMEKELVKKSQSFGEFRKDMQITWSDVRNQLKPGEAAIEFTNFTVRERDKGEQTYYCALLVKPNSVYPEMVKLFEETELSSLLGEESGNNAASITKLYGTRDKSDSRLYKLIWKPLETYLSDVKKVYIAPAGLLYKISFAALSPEVNTFLCDKYEIQLKGSTGTISSASSFLSGENLSALVFGGIKYSEEKDEEEVWSYLNGTKTEADAVVNILKRENIKVDYLSSESATETYLKKNAGNFELLHIATHGFFFPDPNEVRFAENDKTVEYGEVAFRGMNRGLGVNSFVNSTNPLMRSGLVFAGANDVWIKAEVNKEDDGVLTAMEVSQMDMHKTKIVVLSACETGLGDIKGSEGVYGLQRSFKMAGVRYILASLWQVPDKETVEFMENFYAQLMKTKDPREAFAETQNYMRQKYDPYFWAAFGLIE
ncbi:MAG: CHAT domain-containing protein [Bacteroidales bacterium]|nr:CHAT domain-containing protein [Bacteroidales bacterium]